MCLAVPGQLIEITDSTLITRRGKVSFGGIIKEINLSLVPDADIGSYVLVHVGFAISLIDEQEAQRVFSYLSEIGELDELKEDVS